MALFAIRRPIAAARWLSWALVVGLSLVGSAAPAHVQSPTPTGVDANRTRADALTHSLVDAALRFHRAAPVERVALEAEILATAADRFAVFEALLPMDPGAILRDVLPNEVRAQLPPSVERFLEHEVELDGSLTILHEDRIDGSRFHYVLESAGVRYALHFADGPPPGIGTGAGIRVKAVQVDGMLALGGGNVQQASAAPLPNTLGALRTLVILVNFSDAPDQPYTPDAARYAMFGTTSAFFQENSYQQSWLAGDVYGWYTIPVTSTGCDYSSIASYAKSAAVAAGANLSSYDHLVYAFPNNACAWWGLSSVGGTPSQSWINGAFELEVLGHELGHGLGLFHAHALDCGTESIGSVMSSTYPPPAGTCFMIEYGDVIDMMGSAYPGHYSAFEKERLGWINAGVSPPAITVTTSGTYTVEAFEIQSGNPKALKILKATDPTTGARTWYYVEARQPIGFDSVIDTTSSTVGIVSTIPNGVLVHTGTDGSGNSGALLDMNPVTDTSIWDWLVDAPLLPGQTFQDPAAGVSITTESVTSTGAVVTVRFGTGGSSGSESVTIATDQATYTRGQNVLVTATVTDSGVPLANTSVNFQIVKPTGSVVTASATTGSAGTAAYKLRLRKQDPVGTYQAQASAAGGSTAATALTTFVVK